MAFTTPYTVSVGEVYTAAKYNEQTRDNMNALTLCGITQSLFGFTTSPTPTANTAYFARCWLPSLAITTIGVNVETNANNIDVGIYSDNAGTPGTRLWSRGSTTFAGNGQREVNISAGTPTSLTPTAGVGWLAFAADGNTIRVRGTTSAPKGLSYSKASSFPLPASISSPAAEANGIGMVLL